MKVVCPSCHTIYNVKEESVPIAGTEAKCPQCSCMIPLHRESSSSGPLGDRDYGKTMVLFMPIPAQQEEQLKEVMTGLSGSKKEMPAGKGVYLVMVDGDEPGREYPLTETRTTIGRGHADISLSDPEVSRQHAAVEIYGDSVVVKDLQSTNGTFVNQLGVRVSYIKGDDFLQVGNTRFQLVIR